MLGLSYKSSSSTLTCLEIITINHGHSLLALSKTFANYTERFLDIRFWTNNLIWCKGIEGLDVAERYSQKARDIARVGQQEDLIVDFANSLREPDSRIEHRYPGEDRLKKLQELKQHWDAEGVFSRELL
jgi:hypothetical protein